MDAAESLKPHRFTSLTSALATIERPSKSGPSYKVSEPAYAPVAASASAPPATHVLRSARIIDLLSNRLPELRLLHLFRRSDSRAQSARESRILTGADHATLTLHRAIRADLPLTRFDLGRRRMVEWIVEVRPIEVLRHATVDGHARTREIRILEQHDAARTQGRWLRRLRLGGRPLGRLRLQ